MLESGAVVSAWQHEREALLDHFLQRHMQLGELLRRMREAKGWTRQQTGKLYGYYLRANPISPETIERMELTNDIPNNPKRRYILATLLDIPVAYLGLASLDEFAQTHQAKQRVAAVPPWISKQGNIDLAECRHALTFYWQHHQALSASAFHSEIINPVSYLHHNVLYTAGKQRQEMMRLLCYYQQLLANVATDGGEFRTAMKHLNNAYKLAKLLRHRELQALVLCRRAYLSFENGAFVAALPDFAAALSLQTALPAQLKGTILLDAGRGHAHTAQSSQEMTQALRWMDEAEHMVGVGEVEEKGHFLKFDAVRYHLGYAHALVGSPLKQLHHPDGSLEHLNWVQKHTSAERERLNINSELFKAKAWLDKGYYPDVTKLARKTLLAVQGHELAPERTRIEALYQSLKETNYGKTVEVAQLGMDLMVARYPTIFE